MQDASEKNQRFDLFKKRNQAHSNPNSKPQSKLNYSPAACGSIRGMQPEKAHCLKSIFSCSNQ